MRCKEIYGILPCRTRREREREREVGTSRGKDDRVNVDLKRRTYNKSTDQPSQLVDSSLIDFLNLS